MKLSSAFVVASSAIIGSVCAFSNTAPLYASWKLGNDHQYITKSDELALSIDAITSKTCQGGNSKLVVYRVSGLSHSSVPEDDGEGTYIKHVYYSTPDQLDLTANATCDVAYPAVADLESVLADSKGAKIVVVDIEDESSHFIDEFISSSNSDNSVIVQGKPSFHKRKQQHRKQNKNKEKRDDGVEDEYNKIMAEVEAEFEAAKSFLKTEDATVTALGSDVKAAAAAESNKNSNLFTNYQFFTPGLWMTLIVSGFLLAILYIALGWMTSIEISYKAFDKHIDFEKKSE